MEFSQNINNMISKFMQLQDTCSICENNCIFIPEQNILGNKIWEALTF